MLMVSTKISVHFTNLIREIYLEKLLKSRSYHSIRIYEKFSSKSIPQLAVTKSTKPEQNYLLQKTADWISF